MERYFCVMSGIGRSDNKLRQSERNARIIQMMELGRPVRAIAQAEGLEHDYCRKICVKLSAEAGIEYNPKKVYSRLEMTTIGLTENTRRLRSFLADKLYELGDDPRVVAKQIGMTLRCQKYARQRPFRHDWTLSQIERLAEHLGTDAVTLLGDALNAR